MNSVKIGTYQMDTAFGLYLPEYTIPAPAPQTKFVKIIGRDGSVDLSDAIGLHYDSRSWSLDFKCFDPTVNWHTLTSSVMNAIHGKRLNFEFDDDPDYFWTGRISVSSYVSTRGTGTLKVNITSDPFKYAKLSTIVTKTASTGTEYTGSMVTFNGGLVYDLSADIEPTQNLHGYANPWLAGGGVNLFDYTKATYATSAYGLTISHSNEVITVSGTATGTGNLSFNVVSNYADSSLSGQGYIVQALDFTGNKTLGNVYGFRTANEKAVAIRVDGVTSGDSVSLSFKISVATTSQTAWTPYSNICPISGLTGLSVYRTGKNLFGGTLANGYVPLNLPVGTYTVSADRIDSTQQTYFYIRRAASGTTNYENVAQPVVGSIVSPKTFSVEAGYDYYAWCNSTYSNVKDVQFELGSTATTYEPYNGNTYAVDWSTQAGTVYGGTVDVVTGVLTVDMVNIPSYNGETINEPWLSSMDAYTPGATPTTGAQVVYTLATPLTYQLTPQEIVTLVGANNVWSSSGEVSVTVVTPETVTNNGLPIVPTVTASADMVLRWGNYSASVQQGTSTIPQLVLETGDNKIYIIGTGNISFEWSEASL